MMKKNIFGTAALTAMAVALTATMLLTACEDDDPDMDAIIAEWEANIQLYKDIVFDYTALEEDEETFAEDDADYVENTEFTRTVYISYEGDTAIVSGDYESLTWDIDGAHVTVTSTKKNVEYILSGATDNGSFKVYSDNKLKIELQGVSITNPTGAAINDQCGKSMYLVLTDSTESTLTDGSTYTLVGNEDQKGCVFSEGQIIVSGKGTLNIYANYRHGLCSDDYIVMRPGHIVNIYCYAGSGMKSNDGIDIRGGVHNISTTADGAKGLNTEGLLAVSGGRTTIITSGGTLINGTDTTSCAGVKGDMDIAITAGELNAMCSGEGAKGINCNANISITGGTINVVAIGEKLYSSPKGIKADSTIVISGGYVYAFSAASDPIDADGGLTIEPGYTAINDSTTSTYLFEISY